jgi:hypothetical protein
MLLCSRALSGRINLLKMLAIIACLLSCPILKGQPDSSYLKLIEGRMRALQWCGNLYYADRLPAPSVRRSLEGFNEKRIAFLSKANQKAFNITAAELQKVSSEFLGAIEDRLPDSLFPDWKSVHVDSLHHIVERHNNAVRDSVLKLPTSERPQAYCVFKWAFYFSRPVYIRNGTILFYFFTFYRTSSGSYGIYLSEQVNGRWEKGIFISGADW